MDFLGLTLGVFCLTGDRVLGGVLGLTRGFTGDRVLRLTGDRLAGVSSITSVSNSITDFFRSGVSATLVSSDFNLEDNLLANDDEEAGIKY